MMDGRIADATAPWPYPFPKPEGYERLSAERQAELLLSLRPMTELQGQQIIQRLDCIAVLLHRAAVNGGGR